MQSLVFTLSPGLELCKVIERMAPEGGVFTLCDSNTASLVYPLMTQDCPYLNNNTLIVTPAGDENKTLAHLSHIWEELQRLGATRHSLLINMGGGMVTDMGGFAAATFKRGMRCVNVPTTLLGAVDASIGGKTGINFGELKNEIGVFAEAESVIISPIYFNTLRKEEFLSGYAEMLKHGLLQSSESIHSLLAKDATRLDNQEMLELLRNNISVKQKIVEQDPTERGLRKALNLGHTFGHAFESWHLKSGSPVPHGYAVAWGLVCALILSHMHLKFDATLLRDVAKYVERNYGAPQLRCSHYNELVDLMRHDKKNVNATHIQFTLLKAPGKPETGHEAKEDDIKITLDLMRDLMHV
ncbi:MAG: 3-dehydroquinate synthase [Paramuribaculum sp.]|nr:3-dehydroquinate synthase [Paramuribaculum sp.]